MKSGLAKRHRGVASAIKGPYSYRRRLARVGRQSGFSLIEMLVAATILAIGILGLTMLQAMSLRASRGSATMATAALVAEQIMDRAELEGRLSWLNITDANRVAPNRDIDLQNFNLKYINIKNGEKLEESFNLKGGLVVPDDPDPALSLPFFRVSTRRVAVPTAGLVGSVGQMSDLSVRIEFSDSVENNQVNTRTFNLTRRIIHG
ncbi:MAG: prepilin-type N-terminal cleavage/methylation domain-containing protein [Holophagales bacterium]|nr:prepilin-type N-terminal cleavage/methylation domain-containing protein [Holophagales bacterium]